MSVLREVAAVRTNVGFWARTDHTILQISGQDAATWLHSQTSNEVVRLESGRGNQQCLLDRRGRLSAVFTLHRFEDEFWLLMERSQREPFFQRMDTHLFLELVYVKEVGADTPQILVEGPRALRFLAGLAPGPLEQAAAQFPTERHAFVPMTLAGQQVLVLNHSLSGEDGFLLITDELETSALMEALREAGHEFLLEEISPAAQEILRLEAGHARFPGDMDSEIVVSETPLEETGVSYTKGCYLGQEVVARLKAYGTPKQALSGLRFDAQDVLLPEPGTALHMDGTKIGQLRSHGYSPTLGGYIALAYLDRDHRVPGMSLTLEWPGAAAPAHAVVTPLPFYRARTRAERAKEFYDEALSRFEQDADDVDESAIALLREALVLDPRNEDVYEALGVILHRHHRVDEAIGYMQTLAALNPASVMAHTNLSVFYVAKGMIQEAEHEKALAHQLEFQHELDAKAAAKAAARERVRLRQEAEERIAMFAEVLEIDPEDPVATMGMGSALMQLERFADAIPHLQQATRVKKDYSAAFLKLGQCFEALGRCGEAEAAYREGIEVASRKGDLMPLREMERRLKCLAPPLPSS